MNPRWICLLAVFLSLACAIPASAKNCVYKGTYTSTDLVKGDVLNYSVYLVLGDEQPITSEHPSYAKVTGTIIIYGSPLGKKRYGTAPFGIFRTIEVPKTIKGKTRTVEIISQVADADPTDGAEAFYFGRMFTLTGMHTNPLYNVPMTLKGSGLTNLGQLSPTGPPEGVLSRETMQLKLVTSLTDPIPTGEPLADSVKRVTEYLKSRGFIEFLP